ncbi:hypothetical protein H8Z79_14185 [Blautia sp. 2744]|uniref:Uncharacterized protein n=1 Tax=Blautia intestinalis TaxID=2763028 RepID=A0ABR7I4X9_9FIRM|nr:DUF6147 family protein [Blautia intestinalis]MBC5741564.1 hypothetical protein [Blautia intestinalis]RHD30105.1 hypothetical protein DW799_13480 [Blautia obeum]
MSRGKKLLGLLVAVGLSVGMSVTPVLAETTSILDAVAEEKLTDEETTEDFAEDTQYYPARSTNLNCGNVKIQKVSDHELSIYGLTQCHKKCSKVFLSLFLERKVNGSYSTYKVFEYTAKNVTSLEKGLNILVPSGTYYRVRGYHAASNDGLKESASTLTSGIMIK